MYIHIYVHVNIHIDFCRFMESPIVSKQNNYSLDTKIADIKQTNQSEPKSKHALQNTYKP